MVRFGDEPPARALCFGGRELVAFEGTKAVDPVGARRVDGSFIFGLDDDSPDSFERTVEFCIDAKVTMTVVALLTPTPARPLYRRSGP